MAEPGKIVFRGLNGIRALAALGVLVSHTFESLDRFGLAKREGLELASSGVTVFFTLSGFLITYLLLVERERFQRVDLKGFYVRRILRIWPLYFFYIAVALASGYVFSGRLEHAAYLPLFFVFLPNIAFNLDRYPVALGHLWSIGIEEQFYAFWPVVVAKVKRLAPFLFGLVAALVAIRVGAKLASMRTGSKLPLSLASSARFDCMAIGALFAIAHFHAEPRVARVARSLVTPLAFWVFVVLSSLNRFQFFSILTPDVIAALSGAFILSQIRRPGTTLLENPVAAYLGKISFGIYVYHPLVILWLARLPVAPAHPAIAIAAVIATTVGVATASYYLLEQPFLRRKSRFTRVASGGS